MRAFDAPGLVCVVLDIPVGCVRLVAAVRAGTVVEVLPAEVSKGRDVAAVEQAVVGCGDGVLRIRAPVRNRCFGLSGSLEVTLQLPAGSRIEARAGAAELCIEGRLGEVVFAGAYRRSMLGRPRVCA